MKYAGHVMELMAPYPERWWKMIEIVRFVSTKEGAEWESQDKTARLRISKGVMKVLQFLEQSKSIFVRKGRQARGGRYLYRWRVTR